MANIAPRDFWNFPSFRMPSIVGNLDDVLPFTSETGNTISISEDDKHIHIAAAMPGVDPDDVEVTFDKGTLWIRGEAREETEDKKRKYYRKAAQSFSYRITVPGEIDPNVKPEASSQNGMVTITLPKAASSMPQKITVKTGKSNSKAEKGGE